MIAPETYFPSDYREGRHSFIDACEAADLGVTSRLHPDETGADGKPLFLDTTIIGERNAPTALLLMSGTHGVEGYFRIGCAARPVARRVGEAGAQGRQDRSAARGQPVRIFLGPARQ